MKRLAQNVQTRQIVDWIESLMLNEVARDELEPIKYQQIDWTKGVWYRLVPMTFDEVAVRLALKLIKEWINFCPVHPSGGRSIGFIGS